MRALQWTQPRQPLPPKKESDVVVVNIMELRRQKRAEYVAAERKRRQENAAQIAEQRRIANEAIRAGNAALARVRQQWSEQVATFSSVSAIVHRIARAPGVLPAQIMGNGRSRDVTFARQAVMYWTARRSGRSLVEIGHILQRDHTSVLHGKRAYVRKRAAQGRKLRPI